MRHSGHYNLLVGRHREQECAMSYARHMTHAARREALTSIYGVPMPADDRGKVFAKLLTDARHKRGWRQEDVVAATGVSRRTLSRWESGIAERLDPEKVRAVCLALGVDPREAAVALGFLTPDEVTATAPQRPALSQEEEEILAILRDPQVPSSEKGPLVEYLKFLSAQRRNPRKTG
jgi:transcriptional regulator with XRE-family HTH domain